MSFANELKGFASGFKTGVGLAGSIEDTRLRRAQRKRLEPPPDDIEGPDRFSDKPKIETGPATKTDTKTASGGSGKVDNDTNQVASRLKSDLKKDFGISDVAANGIVASLAAESGGFKTLQEISPTVKGSRGGYGYAQWTGPRRRAFEAYAQENGLDVNSYEANYGFLKKELQGPEGRILKDLASAKTDHEAVDIFTGSAKEGRGFLRPGVPNMSGRFAWADRLGGVQPTDVASASPVKQDVAADVSSTEEEGEEEDVAVPEPGMEGEEEEEEAAGGEDVASAGVAIPVPEMVETGEQDPLAIQVTPATMFAAEGGAIPELRYADGGVGGTAGGLDPNPQWGSIDRFSPYRGYTQQPAAPASTPSWQPRKISSAPVGVGAVPTGPTASQVAWRTKPKPEPKKPVTPDPVKKQAQPLGYADPSVYRGKIGGLYVSQAQQIWDNYNKLENPTYAQWNAANNAYGAVLNRGFNARGGGGGSSHGGGYTTSGRGWQEGGIIPEPGEISYARGGRVRTSETPTGKLTRKQFEAETERYGGGQQGRDRAAVAANIREGRRGSSAYRPLEDKRYFQPKKIKEGPRSGEGEPLHVSHPPNPKVGKGQLQNTVRPEGPKGDNTFNKPKGGMTTQEKNAERADQAREPKIAIPEQQGPPIPAEAPATAVPEQEAPPVVGGGVDRSAEVKRNEQAALERERAREINAANQRRQLREKFPNAQFPPDPTAAYKPGTDVVRPQPQAPQPQPNVGFGDRGNTQFKAALDRISAGEDPKAVGDELIQSGEPVELWPVELQNAYYGFDQQPAIAIHPNDPGPRRPADAEPLPPYQGFQHGGRVEEAGYTTSGPGPYRYNEAGNRTSAIPEEDEEIEAAPAPEPVAQERIPDTVEERKQKTATVSATPQLRNDVGTAIRDGLDHLMEFFGLGRSEGAIEVPEDGARRADGQRRFEAGEGAATSDEIADIDDAVDPDRQLDEGRRQMVRMAKVVDWYRGQGREKEAKAAAGSLLQYGAERFEKLGGMAATAYEEYLQTGDETDLQNATAYLEYAYQMIPDGADIDISINPETKRLQIQETDADGKSDLRELSPDELQGVVNEARSGSAYWQGIFRLGDPEGYKSRLREQEARGKEGRANVESDRRKQRDVGYETEKEKRTLGTKLEEEKRANEEADRRRLRDEALTRTRPEKDTTGQDMTKVGPLLDAYSQAKAAADADPENEELKMAVDQAGSRLYDGVGGDIDWLTKQQIVPGESFTYRGAAAANDAGQAGSTPPKDYPNAERRKGKDGQPIWVVKNADGSYSQVVED